MKTPNSIIAVIPHPRFLRVGDLLLLVLLLLFALPASAQAPAAGTPPFGSFSGGPDIVNNGNLNDHWDFPIIQKPGRQLAFSYKVTYDSSVWYPVTSGSTTTWQPTSQVGWSKLTPTGSVTYKSTAKSCRAFIETQWVTENYQLWTGWVYVDSDGKSHPLPGGIQDGGAPDCGPASSATLVANDDSGYKLSVPDETLYTRVGAVGSLFGNMVTDRNGNRITIAQTSSDTLGTNPLTVTGSGTQASPYVFTYTTPSGGSKTYTLNYTNFTLASNFGFSGIGETKVSTPVPLPTSLVLPDNSQYAFTYELTPSTPAPGACTPLAGTTTCVTGRLASVTLPTSGVISYLYYNSGGNFPSCTSANNGAFADGSVACLKRTMPDSSYTTYVRTQVSGNHWQTLVTDPLSNQASLDFQEDSTTSTTDNVFNNFYETERRSYQGSTTSGTLLSTVDTCYNAAAIPCTATAVTLPITQRAVQNTIPTVGSVNLVNKNVTAFNSAGVPTEIDQYTFGSGSAPSTPSTKTLITYASLTNITAFKQQVQVTNGSGSLLAQTIYNYDETTPVAAPAQTPNLSSPAGSRGNLTSIRRCTVLSSCSSTYLQTTMTYDTAGQLLSVKDPLNNTTTFDYTDNFFDDNSGNPPAAHTSLGYPTDAFVKTITPPLSANAGTLQFGYYFYNGARAVSTDQNGNSGYAHFDSIGRPSSSYGPVLTIGGTSNTVRPWASISYNSPTQIDTFTDINDTSATPLTSCPAANSCRQDRVNLDTSGRPIQSELVSDPDGATFVDTTYDQRGQVHTVSHAYRNQQEVTYGLETPAYDAAGRTISVTHPDQTASHMYYGAAVTTTLGGITAQNCASGTHGLGFPTLFLDESGRKRQIWTDGYGRTIEGDEPDSNGNLTTTSPSVCYSYDLLGNLLQVKNTSNTQTRTYAYDPLSRVTSVTTPEAGATSFYYTTSGGTLCSGNPSAVCRRTDARSITTTYTFDALNRPTKKTYSDSTPTVQYGYDGTALSGCATTPPALTDNNKKSRMTAICDGSGATSWTHDAAGRIIQETRTIINGASSTKTQTISYTYNLDGSIYSITYPSTKAVQYTVGNAQRYTGAQDPSTGGPKYAWTASYAAMGTVQSMITGQVTGFAGLNECHSYNQSLEYASTKTTSNACSNQATGTTMDLSLSYNLLNGSNNGDNGSVTTIANNISTETGRTQTLTYDPLNRILSAISSDHTAGHADCWGQNFGSDGKAADDPLANLLVIASAQCNSNALTVTVDGNNHITGTSYGYDAAGNMTGDGQTGVAYTFDAENRMIKATPTGGPYCYVYDGNGLRVAKIQGGTGSNCSGGTYQKLYWRSLSGDSLTETDGTGSVTTNYTEYVFFAGRRITSRVTGSNSAYTALYYYFADQLGSTRTITTGNGKNNDGSSQVSGQLCYDQDYTPYGQEVFTTAQMSRVPPGTACPTNYKFTGYERDSETGLDYAFARYYSSRLGRFMSTDPLGGHTGSPQSHNAYAYTVNNPSNFTDPLGMGPRRHHWPHPPRTGICEPDSSLFGPLGGCDTGSDCNLNGASVPCGMISGLMVGSPTAYVFVPGARVDYVEYGDWYGGVEASWGNIGEVDGEFLTPQAWLYEFEHSYDALSDQQRLSIVANGVLKQASAVGDWRFIAGWYLASAMGGAGLAESGLLADDITTMSRVYRVFGGDSSMYGNPAGGSFTPYNPSELPYYAQDAGLPAGNSAEFVIQGELPLSFPVTVQPATSINGVGGGLTEFLIPNARGVLYGTKVTPF